MTAAPGAAAACDLLDRRARALVATVDDDAPRDRAAAGSRSATGCIAGVGAAGDEPPARARIDASGCLVTPGLVNTHHHLWQNLTRSYPADDHHRLPRLAGRRCTRSGRASTPRRSTSRPRSACSSWRWAVARRRAITCTCSRPDQPSLVEVEILAARDIGLRFHATRGAVDRGRRDGSPMPDHMLETVDAVLADAERLVARYHQRGPRAMVQVALGPHSVFGATPGSCARARRWRERSTFACTRTCPATAPTRPIAWTCTAAARSSGSSRSAGPAAAPGSRTASSRARPRSRGSALPAWASPTARPRRC